MLVTARPCASRPPTATMWPFHTVPVTSVRGAGSSARRRAMTVGDSLLSSPPAGGADPPARGSGSAVVQAAMSPATAKGSAAVRMRPVTPMMWMVTLGREDQPVVFAVAHLTVAAVWLGSMTYSLSVVQPKATRFFSDDRQREEFLTTLAQGNRWKVIGLICALVVTAIAVIVTAPPGVAYAYAVALGLYVIAAAVFADVSWRHWPARIFARPEELPGFRGQLQVRARTMLVLVAAAFLIALSASVR